MNKPKKITDKPHDHKDFSNHDFFLITNRSSNIQDWWNMIEDYTDSERNDIMEISKEQDKKFKEISDNARQEFKRSPNLFCNQHFHSDVEPYEVIRVVSDKCVEIRLMDTKQIKFPSDFHAGGFVGHYADNYNQAYEFISNPENPIKRVRWSKRNNQWQQGTYGRFRMSNTPSKFYDYNF